MDDDEEWLAPKPPNEKESALPLKEQHEQSRPPAGPPAGPSAGSKKDLDIVGWDVDDQENPRNWSTTYKSWITFQLGMLALAASLGTSIIAPAGDTIAKYVGVSPEVSVSTVSLFM